MNEHGSDAARARCPVRDQRATLSSGGVARLRKALDELEQLIE